jgi:hypothetical protein
MNTHFSLKTDGVYLRKISDEPSYHYFRFFIVDPGNDNANNKLLMGTVTGEPKQVLSSIKENHAQIVNVSFRFDDYDETEVYFWAADEWHCIITVHNEGNSIIFTRTHAQKKKQTSEYIFHQFDHSMDG